jgi:hypothetical protein
LGFGDNANCLLTFSGHDWLCRMAQILAERKVVFCVQFFGMIEQIKNAQYNNLGGYWRWWQLLWKERILMVERLKMVNKHIQIQNYMKRKGNFPFLEMAPWLWIHFRNRFTDYFSRRISFYHKVTPEYWLWDSCCWNIFSSNSIQFLFIISIFTYINKFRVS